MVSNFLPPDAQPWVRALENKVKTLETTITSLKKATTNRVSSTVTTPGSVLTLGGEKVPGEGVLNGSLEHLNGVYTLRYGHEFHGLTQYVLIVSGKASGAGELSLLGPEGQVLGSDTLEIDPEVDDAIGFYFAVEFPVLTTNYEFEPEDEDGGGPDIDQEVVASYVLPDTGTLSLVTGATLSELSYEIRSANRSQVTIDTSSGVPTITGLSADGTTIDAMHDYSDTLEFLENALEEARQELADARTEAEQNFDELDDKLGQAFPDEIFDVDLAIDAAMTMANGKNSASYTDVADSVAEPGPAPTQAMGLGRRQFDMHRNRRSSNGQIIGEWMWTGTSWSRLELSDAMLSSLDVGKLTAGTANFDTGVVNKMWGQLGVFDKLDVRTDAYVSGVNLKNGAVTARTLNVVPESGQGGTVLTGTKIGMVNSDGTGMMDLSVDSENYLSFYRDGSANFTVAAEGDLMAKTVSAGESLTYKGRELSEILEELPRGVVAQSMLQYNVISAGPWTELASVSFVPEAGRQYRAVVNVSSTSSASVAHAIGVKFSTRSDFSRTWYMPKFDGGKTVSGAFEFIFQLTDTGLSSPAETTLSMYGQSAQAPAQIAFEGWSTNTSSRRACSLTLEDIGLSTPLEMQSHTSNLGDTESTPTKRNYTQTFAPTWVESYMGGGQVYGRTAGRAYHGQYLSQLGILGSMIGFDKTAIRNFIGSGEIVSATLTATCDHTYSSSGASIRFSTHNATSRPASFSENNQSVFSTNFKRGETKSIRWPVLAEKFKAGTIAGVVVKPTGDASPMRYAYLNGTGMRLTLVVRK